jgi:uncharacterized coiled-coil DUF342 family protein
MLSNEVIEVHLTSLRKGQDELRDDYKCLRNQVGALQTNLSDKISNLSNDVADMRGLQKAMIWVVGGLGSLGLVGKIFNWFWAQYIVMTPETIEAHITLLNARLDELKKDVRELRAADNSIRDRIDFVLTRLDQGLNGALEKRR